MHLTGVVAMFLAAKFEEIYPLRIRIIHEKIAHKKFTKDEIRDRETQMINTLNFNVCPVTIINFIELSLSFLSLKDSLTQKINSHLEKLCVYIGKMIMHDYDL